MLTPQEVAEHAFSKASFGGYNMAMVDEFLDLLTADYTTLYKENAALKTKMKVLADKIEEYRSTEEAMRKALLAAQKMADQMVAEAEEKKATIIADAERDAQDKIRAIRQEVESEQLRLTAAQNATTAYLSKLKDLYTHEMEYLSGLSKLTATPAQPDPVAQAAADIGDAVEKAVAEELTEEQPATPLEEDSLYQQLRREAQDLSKDQPAAQPPVEEDEEDEDSSPTRRIDFSNLKFGKDYEIE